MHDGSDNIVRRHLYRTWGVFCDHAVKELNGSERTFGPYGLVRSIDRETRGQYTARDRDGKRVCLLTKKGVDDLIKQSTCPVQFGPSPDVAPTTFGAWTRPDLKMAFRMARPFEL